MDDSLERPTALSQSADLLEQEDEQSSGDEDQGPDWTKILSLSVSRPVIPKRGEKDFEPSAAGGSGLQRHVLDRARNAMFDALSAPRSISSKSISYAVWYPDIARAHVTLNRGIHFASMGHSVARTSPGEDVNKKVQKRLEMLPEEAIYLVERGAMLCWKASELPLASTPGLEDVEGIPMTVEQAFAEMIGKEGLTLEEYQVFAYLKRLGYVVTRAKPPNADYPVPPPFDMRTNRSRSIFAVIYGLFSFAWQRFSRVFMHRGKWWRPLLFSRWFHHNMDAASTLKSSRFLSKGHEASLHIRSATENVPSPYEIFFNLYKPSTPFKKTAPPQPDFSVVVVNARTTPMPSLTELTDLFGVLPELPPPLPRKRMSFAQQKIAAASATASSTSPPTPVLESSLIQRISSWFSSSQAASPPRKPNPFLALKTGSKLVVIAVVDAGTISFFRFGQGVFAHWPML
ncbi:uncharacterized protein LAESUDRAFT_722880 [Laetiporus sulphureus 93-53]|uniref:tRNA-splicing endonuclease subunit Sen54 N-terminal domain-containing protein n=1 Tax=Laetiporus sulphureus 93-53 TaxID=1314785 RepID=A0A165FLL6_9APHY|nr:uncharacterized protein LAESUDRAFT_722880 [Laetiporus sulphureus 93-53]KZT09154.1 hypothetical protein LAESUDRAFT_722880 [Laetiporus sulphureus 93-53]